MEKHSSHHEISKRLKRAKGHLEKVIFMINEKKPCLEVAQQLQAVESAISMAKKIYIEDHVEHCLDETVFDNPKIQKGKIKEFKEITKYL